MAKNKLELFRSGLKILLHSVIFLLLTAVTQIGGIVYLIALLLAVKIQNRGRIKLLGIFSGLYLIFTFLLIPNIAPIFGREKIKDTEFLRAHSFFYKLANRNYARPELNAALQAISTTFSQQNPGIQMVYLDANFPFFNGFPLLPHLSHSDGKKIDVSLVYENLEGKLSNQKPSISGYGAFAGPKVGELDQIAYCKAKGFWKYDFPKYLSLGTIHKAIQFSEKGTQQLTNIILAHKSVGKMFIEPHLRARLFLRSPKVRYHGCQAVRHDDHIHFQLN